MGKAMRRANGTGTCLLYTSCFGKRESRARRPFKATLYACTQLRLAAGRILLRNLGIPSRLNG